MMAVVLGVVVVAAQVLLVVGVVTTAAILPVGTTGTATASLRNSWNADHR